MLHPQNGDRVVAIDYVALLHSMYNAAFAALHVRVTTAPAKKAAGVSFPVCSNLTPVDVSTLQAVEVSK